jgi:hypothetical protein
MAYSVRRTRPRWEQETMRSVRHLAQISSAGNRASSEHHTQRGATPRRSEDGFEAPAEKARDRAVPGA